MLRLIERARSNDRRAQMDLYERYYPYVISIGLRYTGNREDASELANSAFLKAFERLDTYDERKSFLPWLRKIVVNTALDYLKSIQKRAFDFDPLDDHGMNMAQNQIPSVESTMDVEALDELFLKMPEPMKTFFNLYIMDEYTHAEIGEELQCNERTSKRYLVKAREWLGERISKDFKIVQK